MDINSRTSFRNKENAEVDIWHTKILATEWMCERLPTERKKGGIGVEFCPLTGFSI